MLMHPMLDALKYIKQVLLQIKWETNSNTVTCADFNIPLSTMDGSFRYKSIRK